MKWESRSSSHLRYMEDGDTCTPSIIQYIFWYLVYFVLCFKIKANVRDKELLLLRNLKVILRRLKVLLESAETQSKEIGVLNWSCSFNVSFIQLRNRLCQPHARLRNSSGEEEGEILSDVRLNQKQKTEILRPRDRRRMSSKARGGRFRCTRRKWEENLYERKGEGERAETQTRT